MDTSADPGSFVRRGGVGVPGSTAQKKKQPGQRFLVLGLSYSLQRWSNGFIAERTILSKGSRGGPTFSSFPVGSNFFQGGGGVIQMLISI